MTIDENRGAGGKELDRVGALAVQLMAAAGQEPHVGPDGSQHLIVPDGWRLERLAPLAPNMAGHVSQIVSVDDPESFALYFDAFQRPETRIFADAARGVLTAVIDYHADDEDRAAEPGRCAHRLVYTAPKSVEWTRWAELHRREVPQEALLEFLEENAQDIASPAAADVLELVRDFRSIRATKFQRALNLADGSVSLTYTDEEQGEQKTRVPNALSIAVPVYEGGERTEAKVYLRTRPRESKLFFVLVIHRKEFVERQLFTETVGAIEAQIAHPVLWGRMS
ncbi:hypothetical protein ATO13_08586 [Stappia sp. 22II-S9-Z10]|nr:hypothetical protein ATO13_08586 [Stappia sp. 22II-S9-Z10]